MIYDPNIHHRHSIRLKGYDYSQEGLYYITICVQDRVCLFGNVGAPLVGAQYNNDTQYNNDVQNDVNAPNECAPNNNDIIQNDEGADNILGRMDDDGRQIGQPRGIAPTHARTHDTTPDATDVPTNAPIMILNDSGKMIETEWLKLTERFPNIELHEFVVMPNHFHGILQIVDTDKGQPQGQAPTNKTVGDMMDAFKSITTVEYIRGVKQSRWKPFDGKLWQRNYWEHIIRDDQSYQTISDYIINNPAKWKADKFFNH